MQTECSWCPATGGGRTPARSWRRLARRRGPRSCCRAARAGDPACCAAKPAHHEPGSAPDAGRSSGAAAWRALQRLAAEARSGAAPRPAATSSCPTCGRFDTHQRGVLVSEIARRGDGTSLAASSPSRPRAPWRHAAGARCCRERPSADRRDRRRLGRPGRSLRRRRALPAPEAALRAALASFGRAASWSSRCRAMPRVAARMHRSCWYWLDAAADLNLYAGEPGAHGPAAWCRASSRGSRVLRRALAWDRAALSWTSTRR